MKTAVHLQRDVLDELNWEPGVDAAHIGVTVNEGVVTLTGHVPVYSEKHTAGEVIYSCLPIQERIGLSRPMIMNFEENYPQPLKEKVLANLERWGFTNGAQ